MKNSRGPLLTGMTIAIACAVVAPVSLATAAIEPSALTADGIYVIAMGRDEMSSRIGSVEFPAEPHDPGGLRVASVTPVGESEPPSAAIDLRADGTGVGIGFPDGIEGGPAVQPWSTTGGFTGTSVPLVPDLLELATMLGLQDDRRLGMSVTSVPDIDIDPRGALWAVLSLAITPGSGETLFRQVLFSVDQQTWGADPALIFDPAAGLVGGIASDPTETGGHHLIAVLNAGGGELNRLLWIDLDTTPLVLPQPRAPFGSIFGNGVRAADFDDLGVLAVITELDSRIGRDTAVEFATAAQVTRLLVEDRDSEITWVPEALIPAVRPIGDSSPAYADGLAIDPAAAPTPPTPPTPGGNGSGSGSGSAGLARTGDVDTTPALLVGLVVLALGGALLAAVRRRRT